MSRCPFCADALEAEATRCPSCDEPLASAEWRSWAEGWLGLERKKRAKRLAALSPDELEQFERARLEVELSDPNGDSKLREHLCEAVVDGDTKLVEDLLRFGAPAHYHDRHGTTPLMKAARASQPEVIRILIEKGAPVDATDFADRTPLMVSTRGLGGAYRFGNRGRTITWKKDPKTKKRSRVVTSYRHGVVLSRTGPGDVTIEVTDTTRELLAAGADVQHTTYAGRSALMHAAYRGQPQIVDVLLEAGADVSIADRDGKTALDLASRRGPIAKSLRNAGAQRGTRSGRGRLRRFWHHLFGTMDEFEELRWASERSIMLYIAVAFASVLGAAIAPLSALVAIALLLLPRFPSVTRFPGLLLSRRGPARPHETQRESVAEATVEPSERLEFVSNFVELGWDQIRRMDVASDEEAAARLADGELAGRFKSTVVFVGLLGVIGLILFVFREAFLLNPLLVWIGRRMEARRALGRLSAVQETRDRLAGEIASSIDASETDYEQLPTDFGLYLRTFGVTGKLQLAGIDLETTFAYSLAGHLPLIALGRPGEHLGAGRIQTSDEDWRNQLLQLVARAMLIMLIPSHREGTRWEIAKLRELHLFHKTILVMPPELTIDGLKLSQVWNETAAALRATGLQIPDHFSRGLLFQLDDQGRVWKHAPFGAEELLRDLEGSGFGGTGVGGDGDLDSDLDLDLEIDSGSPDGDLDD